MGVPHDSFQHDTTLESICLKILNLAVDDGTRIPASHVSTVKKWLRQLQDTRSHTKPHARTQSIYRFPATAWEALCVDWYQRPDDPWRASALLCLSARIVSGALNHPDRLQPMMDLAHVQAANALTRFDNEAGRSGLTMDDLNALSTGGDES